MVAVMMTMLATPPTLWLRGRLEVRLGFAFSFNFSPILESDYYNPDKPILPAYDGTQKDLILTLPEGVTVRYLQELFALRTL